MRKIALFIICGIFLFGCDKNIGEQLQRHSFAKSVWQEQSSKKDYRYILSIEPSSPGKPIDHVIKVKSGKSSFKVTKIQNLGTIDGIFIFALETLKKENINVRISYDGIYGFPSEIKVHDPKLIDASYSVRVTNFEFL